MKRFPGLTLILLLGAMLTAACQTPPTPPGLVAGSPAFSNGTAPQISPSHSARWIPAPSSSWQIQLSGSLDTTLDVDIFFLDLFDTPENTIQDLHARGIKVVCHFSAGSYEDGRPDSGQFPGSVLGNAFPDSPVERWLDIRALQTLGPIMLGRIRLAVQKGCDGVDPDRVNGYLNETGFPLTAEDQLAYNTFLANAAHQSGLSIGLRDDLPQIPLLLPLFDWAMDEGCFSRNECDQIVPFSQAGKPVFIIEYSQTPEVFCGQANALNFNIILKNPALDASRTTCR